MKRLKLSFEGMKVGPNDVVVIRPREDYHLFQAKELYESIKKSFPNNEVVIIRKDDSLDAYDKERFIEFLENLKKKIT